jgi:hypothetical protein
VSLTVDVTNLASEIVLPFARPNPFRPSQHGLTSLVLALGASVPAGSDVAVYDARGRAVRTLTASVPGGFSRLAVWDGRDDAGRPLPAGVYFFRLGGVGDVTGRVVLLR